MQAIWLAVSTPGLQAKREKVPHSDQAPPVSREGLQGWILYHFHGQSWLAGPVWAAWAWTTTPFPIESPSFDSCHPSSYSITSYYCCC